MLLEYALSDVVQLARADRARAQVVGRYDLRIAQRAAAAQLRKLPRHDTAAA